MSARRPISYSPPKEWYIYLFLFAHVGMYSYGGFMIAYSSQTVDISKLYTFGCVMFITYFIFYILIFGLDEVKWIVINTVLGFIGIVAEIDWLLSFFDRKLGDYPLSVHVVPFTFYILFMFLLRQAVVDITKSRNDVLRKKRVETRYIIVSAVVYAASYLIV